MYYHMNIAGLDRDLPICPVSDSLYIAGFVIFGDQELTVACARELLKRAPEYDYIITAEAKGIPLAYEMARQSGKYWIPARKGPKLYMREPVIIEDQSITTAGKQTLVIDKKDIEYMDGKRILIVDDVISTGGSLHALETLAAKSTGTVLFVAITAKPAGQLFTLDGFPALVSSAITGLTQNSIAVMILIFLLLCVIGMFMDATAAIYIFMPILLPTAVSVGISPLFFVVFMVIALSFGLITPPVGVCLYAACNVSGMSIEKITKGLVPWLIVLVLCLLVFILFPNLITYPISILFPA